MKNLIKLINMNVLKVKENIPNYSAEDNIDMQHIIGKVL